MTSIPAPSELGIKILSGIYYRIIGFDIGIIRVEKQFTRLVNCSGYYRVFGKIGNGTRDTLGSRIVILIRIDIR